MATSQLYNGDGSTTAFTFTVPYINTTDIKATIGGVSTTAFSVNGTTVTFNSAPASGTNNIKIFRDTNNSTIEANFQSGSALRAVDFNDNFTQLLYVTQESTDGSDTAITDSAAALAAATTASTNATNAVNTANTASATATAAQNAVSAAAFFTPILALANLPTSPADEDRVEVTNSTGVESNSSVSTVPAGFVGSTDLTVRLQYNSSTSKWVFQQYFAADPESRYVAKSGSTMTGALTLSGAPTSNLHAATKAYVDSEAVSTVLELTDAVQAPTSNTIVFEAGSSGGNPSNMVTGTYSRSFGVAPTLLFFSFGLGNSQYDDNLNSSVISVGDSITFEWPTGGSTNNSRTFTSTINAITTFTDQNRRLITISGIGNFSVPNESTSTLRITHSSFTNGLEPVLNNQVLRYKTATSKWTVASVTEPDPDTALTDVAQTFTAAQRGEVTTLTSAATITIDFGLSNNFTLTTGHSAILFANPTTEVAGQSGSIFIVQGSTTCAAPTWGNQWYFSEGTAPALTGTTGKIARIDYIVQEAGKIHAVATDNLAITT